MYHFAFDGKGALRHTILHGAVVIKSNESKSSWSSSLLIHHQSSIKNSSELFEILFKFLLDNILSNPADKDLRRFVLFVPGNRSFRINLGVRYASRTRGLTIFPSRICSLTMTALTHLGSLKVRNPNPRDRPVWFSRITVHSVISPNCSKYARIDSSLLVKFKTD